MAEPASARRFDGFVPGFWQIDSYGNGGFRFAGMSHRGSIIASPAGVSAWGALEAADISEAALQSILEDGSGIGFLLIGTGTQIHPVDPTLRAALRERRIACEVMTTAAAISTYHVLAAEARRVAAALLAVA